MENDSKSENRAYLIGAIRDRLREVCVDVLDAGTSEPVVCRVGNVTIKLDRQILDERPLSTILNAVSDAALKAKPGQVLVIDQDLVLHVQE